MKSEHLIEASELLQQRQLAIDILNDMSSNPNTIITVTTHPDPGSSKTISMRITSQEEQTAIENMLLEAAIRVTERLKELGVELPVGAKS